jgi:putative transcriptional regulator
MIKVNLKQKMLDKSASEGRHLTIDEIAKVSGVSRITLLRIKSDPFRLTKTDIIDKLCTYFECTPGELLEQVKEKA